MIEGSGELASSFSAHSSRQHYTWTYDFDEGSVFRVRQQCCDIQLSLSFRSGQRHQGERQECCGLHLEDISSQFFGPVGAELCRALSLAEISAWGGQKKGAVSNT